MPAQTEWMRKRALLARKSRDLPQDHPDIVALRTELRTDRAAEYLGNLVAENPLTDEQRTRLAELLKPVRRAAGA